MRKALYILGELNDNDVEWLAHNGAVRRLRDGEVIIREGETLDTLFITLEGELRVILGEGREVARLGAGEVVGEIAFVEASPPSATVSAIGNAVVLTLKKSAVQQHLAEHPEFAARFYRALAVFLADRLRATTRRLGYGNVGDLESEARLQDELDPGVLDTISQAGDRFTRLLRTLTAR
jgi:CRP/FNR family transcriptional regulator, cyclic AMP receptor protein